MPVYIHLSNLIVNKESIAEKCQGGIEQFRQDFQDDNELFQEDQELFCLASMNSDEFNIAEMTERGLSFDQDNQRSDDFVVVERYGGALWETSWLECGAVYAFHKDCSLNNRLRAYEMEMITMDEVQRIFANGGNPFQTIK